MSTVPPPPPIARTWLCDVCKVAKFTSFDEACRHEEICFVESDKKGLNTNPILGNKTKGNIIDDCDKKENRRDKIDVGNSITPPVRDSSIGKGK